MMTTMRSGAAALAVALIALGILGLGTGDFALVWQPVPQWVPGREILAYAFGAVSLAAGLGLLWRRTAAPAAALALGYFFLWWLLLRVPAFVASPLDAAGGLGENTVALSGALALYAALRAPDLRALGGRLDFLSGARGIGLARMLLGLGLIGCGEAHFRFLKETAAFIPAWIPGHLAWAAATGSAFLAAAAAILFGVRVRLAASLAAAMMAVFTVVIWLVGTARAPADRLHWTGLAVSWTLAAAAWAVAETWRDTEWVAASGKVIGASFARERN
ncbi:MAG: DoxX family protein [Steroidobacterales bacterium]